jgi:5-(carboxyamino)imidazole ribonucleotide synthase
MLGMLGGGQLGRFFVIAAQKMGYAVVVLDPDKKSPAGQIADIHLCKSYDDVDALDQLKSLCQAVTTEFENIPATTLEYLEKNLVVCPGSNAVSIVQNRIKEKTFLQSKNIPVGEFVIINNLESIKNLSNNQDIFPAILKTAQFGYDGKGQIHVKSVLEVENAFRKFNLTPCILEKKLKLDLEVSVVLARSNEEDCVIYPLIENHHQSGILDLSIIPAHVNDLDKEESIRLATKIANDLDYVGVMAVEFFICSGRVIVNEIAPRPHNSGHFSIDACTQNQFDQQVLALTGNALGIEKINDCAVMLNLLGDIWLRDGTQKPPRFDLVEGPQVNVHLYDKEEARIGRKMGHITLVGNNTKQLIDKVERIREVLWKN